MEPIQRRHKGIAEWINLRGAVDDFRHNEAYRTVIASVPALDMHSASLHDLYGKFVHMIDWIPMTDFSPGAVIDFTNRLLWDHGISAQKLWDMSSVHHSDNDMKLLQQQVAELYQNLENKDLIMWYFYPDILLHSRVIERFDHRQSDWGDMSWLRH